VPPCRYRARGRDIVGICHAAISWVFAMPRAARQYRGQARDIAIAAWYRAFPRYREREARYRAAGPDIAACTDDIVHVRDIVRGARYRPPRAISRVRVVI
jgi:hypothetical protein